jgi:hypothetical protein
MVGGGLFAVIMRRAVFKHKTVGQASLFLGAAAGYAIAANGVNTNGSVVSRKFDEDITRAFDERYLRSALVVSGLFTNHTSIAHNEDNNDFSKPY